MKQTIELKMLSIILTLPMLIACFISGIGLKVEYVYFLYFAIVAIDICLTRKIEFSRITVPLYLSLFIFWCLLPFALFHIDSINGAVYVFLLILFLLAVNVIGRDTVFTSIGFIKYWAIFAVVICLIQVARNIGEINIDTIQGVLYDASTKEHRIRASFGFYHPNSTAYILAATMLLQYIMYVETRIKYYLATMLICVIPLLCTGSRTGTIGIITFFIMELFFYILQRTDRGRIFVKIGAIVLIALVISSMDFSDIDTASSGRSTTIFSSLEVMYHNHSLLFGAIVTNISHANSTLKLFDLQGSDNAYYSIIIRFGVVGLVTFLSAAIYFVKKLYDESINYGLKTYCVSMFIMLMVYGLGENVLFNQSSVLCFLVWVFLFRQIYIRDIIKSKFK